MFETDKDVLDWYEQQPPAVTREFIDSIPWRDVSNYALNLAFVPVLIYMRDIEYFTDMYYRELLRSPTGKDPIIKKFMDRWRVEEDGHANLLNRFLNEAGIPTSEKWRDLWTLFNGSRGLDAFDRTVASRIERLPGFTGFTTLTERVAPIVQA